MSSYVSSRYVYSSWDIQQALSALTFLMDEYEPNEISSRLHIRKLKCFENTLIIAFCRPFKTGRGRASLELEEIGIYLSDEEAALIEKVIWLRDKIIAHSDEEAMEYRATSFQIFEDSPIISVSESFPEYLYFNNSDHRKLEVLLRRIRFSLVEYKFKCVQNPHEIFDIVKKKIK
ncbi:MULTISPECIES: hypothetical protein [Cobetia]|uniref:hypothetical protein n=1 Tax=Cobetia TaxID=204286 RepID=UPI0015967505|nr:hypothetical protein [Cobetia sp. 5-11-6-3]